MHDLGDELLAAIADDAYLQDLGLGTVGGADKLREVCEDLVLSVRQVVAGNAEQYEILADQLERSQLDGIHDKLAPAMRRDLLDWDPHAGDVPDQVRARERIYWLAVALCDRRSAASGIDLSDVLARTASESRLAYRTFYARLLEVSGREPVWGNDGDALTRLQNTITILLEGATVARRARYPFEDDDIVTATIALFHIFTRRPDESPFDLEAALRGLPQPETETPAPVTTDTLSSYDQVVARLERLRDVEPGVVRHASLHGVSGAVRTDGGLRPAAVDAMRVAVNDLVRRGWKLRRLVTLYTEDDFTREVATAGQIHAETRHDDGEAGTVRVQATVGGVGGHAATVVVEGHFATIGLDDPDSGFVKDAVFVDNPALIEFWVKHFDQVFDDRSHTYVIWDRRGARHDHIEQLRARVKGMERVLFQQLPPVRLTDAEQQVVAVFTAHPNFTNDQIATELVKSVNSVKGTMKELFRKLDVRTRAELVSSLRQRGMA